VLKLCVLELLKVMDLKVKVDKQFLFLFHLLLLHQLRHHNLDLLLLHHQQLLNNLLYLNL
jgi:hypothetical protein